MFGSIAAEGKASVAGSIHPSAEGATGSELKVGAAADAISLTLSDGRASHTHRDRMAHKAGA